MELTRAQRLNRLLRLQVIYVLYASLHWILGYRFLVLELGFTLEQALLVSLTIYASSVLVLFAVPKLELRWALRAGLLFRVLAILPYWLWPTPLGIYLGAMAFGVALVLFWVPYNVIYFEHRSHTDRAGMSATYAAVVPFVDVGVALLAGWLVMQGGYVMLFASASLLGLVPLAVSFRMRPTAAIRTEVWARSRRLRGIKTIITAWGIQQGISWTVVPLITIFIVSGTFAYAGFFAFIGLAGAVTSILLGRISDRSSRRVVFVIPFAILFALSNAFSAVAIGVLAWGVWRGVASGVTTLFEPFKNAIYLDLNDNIPDLYFGRELLLNIGRVVGVLFALLFAHFQALQYSLVIPALVGILVPALIEFKGLYPEERILRRILRKPTRRMFRQ